MKKIIFLLLIGVFTLNSCGPSAEEKAQMERRVQERRAQERRETERKKELKMELAIENIDNTIEWDWEKCWGFSSYYRLDDYGITEFGGGYIATIKVWHNGDLLGFQEPSLSYICKIKYDLNGKFKKCISKRKY